jgi:23S rRNA (uracil1939-C5)-methyltransferase
VNIGDQVQLTIERLSYDGGRGVGRLDGGRVVFVPLTAPGDKIKATLNEIKSSFATGTLTEILEPSPERTTPGCPVFGRCGGCRWQHVTYKEQVRQKSAMIEFALKKLYSKPVDTVPAPNPYNYRNRIQLHKKGNEVGYYAEGTHELVPIQGCPIADERLQAEIKNLPHISHDGRFEIAYVGDKSIVRDLKNEMSEFTQVNEAQNQRMKEIIFGRLEKEQFSLVYDLYCGDGNFTFPLAYFFKQTPIRGVETSVPAIVRADAKARAANIKNAQFQAQDVKEYLKRQDFKENTLMLLDPPRAGLEAGVIKEILRLLPSKMIYISCNLSTLARDLEKMKTDYSIDEVVGVDMFPQTEYVETLSFLSRL